MSPITQIARDRMGIDFGDAKVITDSLVVYVDATRISDERKARDEAGDGLAEPVDGPEDIPINGFDPWAKVYWFRRKGD